MTVPSQDDRQPGQHALPAKRGPRLLQWVMVATPKPDTKAEKERGREGVDAIMQRYGTAAKAARTNMAPEGTKWEICNWRLVLGRRPAGLQQETGPWEAQHTATRRNTRNDAAAAGQERADFNKDR